MSLDVYDVRGFGAIGDGQTLNTQAIQAVIDRCGEDGGGTVVLSQGCFVTGTLILKSKVTLRVTASAVLMGSPHIEDYSTETHHNRYTNEAYMDRCLIFAQDVHHIGLVGEGEINGNALAFPNEGSTDRPMMIRTLRCRNVRLQGLRLYHAPGWTTAFLDSTDLWCRDLDIFNEHHMNGDGLDFDGCRNVFIDGCKINGTDDNLCLQSSSSEFPMENVHISNCLFTSVCAGIRIGLKSVGTIAQVVIENCVFERVWREGIKIECSEGGCIRDIVAHGLVMRDVRRPIFILLNNRLDRIGSTLGLAEMPEIGKMERIQIAHVSISDSPEMKNTHWRFGKSLMGSPRFNGIRIDAERNHPIKDLVLCHLSYTALGGVGREVIPEDYPKVLDRRSCESDQVIAENYFPDWSRTTFMDIRNVQALILDSIRLHTLEHDTREPYLLEGCHILKQNIQIQVIQ